MLALNIFFGIFFGVVFILLLILLVSSIEVKKENDNFKRIADEVDSLEKEICEILKRSDTPMPNKEDKDFIEKVVFGGIEKTRFGVIDKCGVNFRASNFIFENKVYFVGCADEKIVACKEVAQVEGEKQ